MGTISLEEYIPPIEGSPGVHKAEAIFITESNYASIYPQRSTLCLICSVFSRQDSHNNAAIDLGFCRFQQMVQVAHSRF